MADLNLHRPSLPTKRVLFGSIRSVIIDDFIEDASTLPFVVSPISEDINGLVEKYNNGLSSLLDRHAPLRSKTIVLRSMAPWMSDVFRTARRSLRKSERLRRLKHLTVFYDLYRSSLRQFSNLLRNTKLSYITVKVNECKSDQKALFCLIRGLTGQSRILVLPVGSSTNVTDDFSTFFHSKVDQL